MQSYKVSAWMRLENHRARASGFRDMWCSQWLWKQDCGCPRTGTDKGQGLGQQLPIRTVTPVTWLKCSNTARSCFVPQCKSAIRDSITLRHYPFLLLLLFFFLFPPKWDRKAKCILWSTGRSCSTLLQRNVVLNKDDNIARLMKLKFFNV